MRSRQRVGPGFVMLSVIVRVAWSAGKAASFRELLVLGLAGCLLQMQADVSGHNVMGCKLPTWICFTALHSKGR